MVSNNKGRTQLMLALLTSSLCLFPASQVLAARIHNLNDEVVMHMPHIGVAVSASERAAAIGLDIGETLVLKRSEEKDGIVHERYRQHVNGIPVWGQEVIFHSGTHNGVRSVNGVVAKGILRDLGASGIRPLIDSSVALRLVKKQHSLRLNKGAYATPLVYEREISELVVFIDEGVARLAYHVSFFANTVTGNVPTRPHYIVDAANRQVLSYWEGLTTERIGSGPGGNTKTGTVEYGTNLAFLDVAKVNNTCTFDSVNVKSVDLSGNSSNTAAFTYPCSRNTFKAINGAQSPLNDAHYYGGVVFDMYQNWYGTRPVTFQLVMRVHAGTKLQNAYWDGANMNFGDGGDDYYPLVSLDLAAHEISHGFTEQHSDLISIGEAGGINEAFSDMAGEAAKFYLRGSNDWKVGLDIRKDAGAERYMDTPTADGESIDNAANYKFGMDAHLSSGVYNRAFYVLATTQGWSTKKAFEVMVNANRFYWTWYTDFATAACGVINAANDRYYSVADVNAAFVSVGVSCQKIPTQKISPTWLAPVLGLLLD